MDSRKWIRPDTKDTMPRALDLGASNTFNSYIKLMRSGGKDSKFLE